MPIASPRLRQELEVIRGMDDIPLIFDPVTGSYHRITRAGEVVLSYLDGSRTREELVELFAGDDTGHAEKLRAQIDGFLATLESSGLLDGTGPPPGAGQAGRRVKTSRMMPRVVITRKLPVLLEPVAGVLRRMSATVLVGVFAVGAIAGFCLGLTTLFTRMPNLTHIIGPPFLVAAALQLLLVLCHETCHALVAQVLKVPVRGLGVALLFYFMPVAYVDRTDAYRHKGKGGRITLAMAGVMSDGWWCGVVGLVALNTHGFVQQSLAFLLAMQLMGLVINLNPLLPSDGFVALETAFGSVDARGRAFTLIKSRLLRREPPAYLAALSRGKRAGLTLYGAISAAYTCLVAYGAFRGVPAVVGMAVKAVQG
ncbi:hypothetical protein Skr01_21640 [Sphaerisporangium krabiense]|uniref:Putative peptide zinc metalloprotease protein n=1 Tax=Sphaerisporangium krabiense TaxID=763782 RepID=A0A7W8Z5X8_9ACTN|nr:PqqD family protein [Sphaerisporangium krabiense]MBB5627919.1 putative peptide zinc metalloprotease protein [Sphaerisporangium krabiense]GII62079.1 hypothetical protein Skr01_21640 [Sphaerisporangium krabiense]